MDEIDCTGERAVHLNAYIPKKSRSGETYTNASVHPNVLAAKCLFFLKNNTLGTFSGGTICEADDGRLEDDIRPLCN